MTTVERNPKITIVRHDEDCKGRVETIPGVLDSDRKDEVRRCPHGKIQIVRFWKFSGTYHWEDVVSGSEEWSLAWTELDKIEHPEDYDRYGHPIKSAVEPRKRDYAGLRFNLGFYGSAALVAGLAVAVMYPDNILARLVAGIGGVATLFWAAWVASDKMGEK